MFSLPNTADTLNEAQSGLDATDFAILAAGINGEGVVSGCGLTVVSGLTVRLAAGSARTGVGAGVAVAQTDFDLTSLVNASLPKKVLIQVIPGSAPVATGGVASNTPIKPVVSAGAVGLWEVYLPANATSVAAINFTDKRCLIKPALYDLTDVSELGSDAVDDVLVLSGLGWVNAKPSLRSTVTFMARDVGSQTPGTINGTQELFANTRHRLKVDCSRFTAVRLQASLVVTGTGSLRAQYSINSGSSWNYFDHVSGPTVFLTVPNDTQTSSWVDLNAAAKADVLVRLVTVSTSVSSPTFCLMQLEFRHTL